RRGGLLDRRLRPVDLQSRKSRTGLGDVPADARPLPHSYSLGHVPAVEGADGRATATTNRRNLDYARVDRDASGRRPLVLSTLYALAPSRFLAISIYPASRSIPTQRLPS